MASDTHGRIIVTAYLVADVEVLDSAAYEDYKKHVGATVAAYGGRFLARGGATETLEGSLKVNRCVILEFPNMERLKAWWSSAEYGPLRDLRQRTAKSTLVAIEGV